MIQADEPLIRRGEVVASAGSCFASNLVPYLTKVGFTYLQTETVHPSFRLVESENLGYSNFSAAYGNVYTARQLLQLLRRSRSLFTPVEDRWLTKEGVIDPFRPGLKYFASSIREFDMLIAQHLKACLRVFMEADVFIFTLGLTEAWLSKQDGAVFPVCPGTVAGTFEPDRHVFKNFSAHEVTADVGAFIEEIREINPRVRIILTVSPVPLVATASNNHVLCASVYSKSVLRVAAQEVAQRITDVTYFPAYEIVTGPQAPKEFFEDDKRNVSLAAVDQVMEAFLGACESDAGGTFPVPAPTLPFDHVSTVAKAFIETECEELMVDRH